MNGIAFLVASFHLPVFPHMSPNEENKNPESPIVGALVYMGRKLANMAITKDGIGLSLFRMLHKTIKLIAR